MFIHRIQQISEEHCGPAVLAMLLQAIDISVTQQDITIAAGAEKTIHSYGVTPLQLARSCAQLAPQAQFWSKYHATLDDIRGLLHLGFAVGVEWQGLFYDSVEEEQAEEDEDADFGHYSIVTFFDDHMNELIIVDPYKDFAHRDRIMDTATFMSRWWEVNEVLDPLTHQRVAVRDDQLLFCVTPKSVILPPHLGLRAFQP